MKRLPLPLLIGAVMLITFSCQETQVASLQTEPSTIRLVDGRISFPSQEAFRATVQELARDQEHLDKFDDRFSGYVSMRAAYDQLTDADAEKIVSKIAGKKYDNFAVEVGEGEDREITRVIGDPILATLVNAEGWLQIGKELFKFKRDKFFVLENTSQARMAQVELGLVSSSDVKLGKVIRNNQPGVNARMASQHCLQEYWVGNNKRRMAGDLNSSDYSYNGQPFYTSVSLITKHQKRVLGTSWWEMNAPSLRLTWSIRVSDPTNLSGTTETGSLTSYDDGWLEQSYPSSCYEDPIIGQICNAFYSQIQTEHWVGCTDNTPRWCNLSQ